MNWVPPWISTLIDEKSPPGELILRRKLPLASAPLWREYSEVSQNWLSSRALNCPEGLPDWILSLSVSPPHSLPGLPAINSTISHLHSNALSESASGRADQSQLHSCHLDRTKETVINPVLVRWPNRGTPDRCGTRINLRTESRTVKGSEALRQEGGAYVQKVTRSGK